MGKQAVTTFTYVDPYKNIVDLPVSDPNNIVSSTIALPDILMLYATNVLKMLEDGYVPRTQKADWLRRFIARWNIEKSQENSLENLRKGVSLILWQSSNFFIWQWVYYARISEKLRNAQENTEEYAKQVWKTLWDFRVLAWRSEWDWIVSSYEWTSVSDELRTKLVMLDANDRFWM